MILSVSRRTDIPAFYSEWLIRRLKAGYCLVRNPMNPRQISRIFLSPETVDCIVFWTKNPIPMLDKLPALDSMGYRYYFQFTLTPYGNELERNLPEKPRLQKAFRALAGRLGAGRVVWRYDPIILNGTLDTAWHRREFEALCRNLQGYTDTVVISFVDAYAKVKSALLRPIEAEEMLELAGNIGRTAKRYGIRPVACCEASDFTQAGIGRASCIDRARIEQICGYPLRVGKDKNQRAGCGCCESIDIGAYDTCPNGCVYCYANRSAALIEKNQSLHDPDGELLFGQLREGDRITDRKAAFSRQEQMQFEV